MNRKEFYSIYNVHEKPASTFYHRYVPKKFGKLIAYPLYKLNLSPNLLSLSSFLLLLLSIFNLFYFNGLIGQILFFLVSLISYSLDCIDGVIARISEKQTKFGAFFDLLLDRAGELILYIAVLFYSFNHLNQIEMVLLSFSLFIRYIYGIASLIRAAKVPEMNDTMKRKDPGILKNVVKFFYEFTDTGTFYFFLTICFILSKFSFIIIYGALNTLMLFGMIYIVFKNEFKY